MKKKIKKLVIILFAVCSIFSANSFSFAETPDLTENSIWTADKISAEIKKTDKAAEILLSAKQLEDDYGYVVLKGKAEGKLDEESRYGLQILCSIKGVDSFFVSAFLEDGNGKLRKMKKDALFAIQTEKETVLYRAEEGNHQIDGDFQGKFIVPFSSFEENEEFQKDNIKEWGLGFVLPEESTYLVKIENVESLSAEIMEFEEVENAQIIGPSALEIPVNGEAIASYRISDSAFTWNEPEGIPGVVLWDGEMVISKEAAASEFVLEAENGKGIKIRKMVEIREALRNSSKFLPDFPSPEEVTEIGIPMKNLIHPKVLMVVRIAGVIILTVILAAYIHYYKIARKEQKEEI